MKLYSRYLLYKTIIGFTSFVLILVSLIWFSRAIVFVDYITENGIAIGQFLSLFVLILPWLLLFIIPISLFVAVLVVYNRLIFDNEITILKNSGLTKIAISKPIFPLAIFLSLVCFIISFYLMPYANRQMRISRLNFENNYTNLMIKSQTFQNLKNLTIYAKNRDEENNLFGILLHDERSKTYSITITAKQGKIVVQDDSGLLQMERGSLQKYNNQTRKSEILYFDSYVFNLNEEKQTDSTINWKPKEKYFNELISFIDDLDEEVSEDVKAKYRIEINQRVVYPLITLVLPMIALSSILQGAFSRRGNVKNILLAVFLATLFLGLIFMSYDLIEKSAVFVFLPYLLCFLFLLASYFMMVGNYRKKRNLANKL